MYKKARQLSKSITWQWWLFILLNPMDKNKTGRLKGSFLAHTAVSQKRNG